jgi:hypothetical protein
MELLLNILWLALALPAVWIWQRKPGCALRRFGRSCPILLLGCVLVLLFPVVSATDDLHAMRPEMEESNPFSSVQKQSGGARAMTWTHATGSLLAHFVSFSPRSNDDFCGLVFLACTRLPELVVSSQGTARAPPATNRG